MALNKLRWPLFKGRAKATGASKHVAGLKHDVVIVDDPVHLNIDLVEQLSDVVTEPVEVKAQTALDAKKQQWLEIKQQMLAGQYDAAVAQATIQAQQTMHQSAMHAAMAGLGMQPSCCAELGLVKDKFELAQKTNEELMAELKSLREDYDTLKWVVETGDFNMPEGTEDLLD